MIGPTGPNGSCSRPDWLERGVRISLSLPPLLFWSISRSHSHVEHSNFEIHCPPKSQDMHSIRTRTPEFSLLWSSNPTSVETGCGCKHVVGQTRWRRRGFWIWIRRNGARLWAWGAGAWSEATGSEDSSLQIHSIGSTEVLVHFVTRVLEACRHWSLGAGSISSSGPCRWDSGAVILVASRFLFCC